MRATEAAAAPFAVLVNSSPGYADCWEPFFRLFARNWPDCPAPVFLNTGGPDWHCADRAVTCLRDDAGRRTPWSDSLLHALHHIRTPLVLYLQEDYFLRAPVDGRTVTAFAELMARDPAIGHIGLTHFGALGPFAPTADERLWRVSRHSRYRISTQAALWRTDRLRSYLRPGENAWMFEIFGTARARRRDETFLTVNRERFGPGRRVMDYPHTGLVRGRWHPEVPALFAQAGVEVDYERRGFYRPESSLARRAAMLRSVAGRPLALLRALWDGVRSGAAASLARPR